VCFVSISTILHQTRSIVELNTYLTGQSMTPEQLTELYCKAFIHVNLNTGTREEILLIRCGRAAARWGIIPFTCGILPSRFAQGTQQGDVIMLLRTINSVARLLHSGVVFSGL
jgi:hypothetical protein